jgi:hypothetical protein
VIPVSESRVKQALSEAKLPDNSRVKGSVAGDVPYDIVTWDEWAESMKLSGGKLCLHIENPTGEFWVQRRVDGMLEGWIPGEIDNNRIELLPNELRQEVQFSDSDVKPVHRENTPFSHE